MTSKKSSRKNKAISAFDEQTFRLMFEGHSAVMLLIEPQTGEILEANQAAVDFYGYPKLKLCGMSIDEINALSPEQAGAERQKAINEGRNYLVLQHRLSSGEERTVEVHSSSIALQEKQVLFCIIHDITERKHAEESFEKRIIALTLPLENTESITFNDLFNLEDIQRLQDEFAKATGVASIITQTDGTPITAPSNFCRLCNDIIRKTPRGYVNCCKSDAALGQLNPKGPMVQPCMSGGLWDAGAGISVGGKHIANWLIGQIRDETQAADKMLEYARIIGVNEQVFLEAFNEVPAMSREKFEQIAKVLFTLANQLSTMAYQNFQQARFITERKQAEEALKVEQYLMDALVDNVFAHIYFKDRESRFIRINNALSQLFGLSNPGQAVGRTDFDFFTSEHAQQAYEDEQEIIRTGQTVSKEEKETWDDLPDTWVSTTKLALRDKDKKIIGTFGISVDITERKRAEERLVAERNLLSTLLDALPDRVYVKDIQGRKIISNVADWQGSGRKTIEDMLGKTDFETYPSELAAKFWADDKSVLDTGIPIISHEELGLDSQGNPIWVLTTKVPLRDGNGQVTGLVGIGRDITERKQAEEALNESKLLFHLLIESLPQNIYAKDINGRFIFANQHYCATQGRPLEEIVGKTDFELHPPELAEKYRMDDLRVIEMGKTIELDEEHQPIGKKKFFVQVIKTPLYDSKGQTAGVLGIFWDITERKQAEAELRRAQDALETAHRELQQSFAREQQLAHMDELTGINNHRSLLQLAEREFNVAMRYRLSLSMMFFDIDDFKQVNDTFGHAMGDQALKKIIQVVCAELRSADAVGRYGGDEFIILLPRTSAQEALPLAERIHASVAAMRMETDKGPLSLTISIGIAQTIHYIAPEPGYNTQTDTVENLLLRADQALYAAKQAGRNRTVIFDQK